jgi:hypothetical protein
MGYLIGKPPGPSTWGQLRSVIVNGTKPFTFTWRPPHSLELDHGFKTSVGNGFIRTDVTPMFLIGDPSGGNYATVYAAGIRPGDDEEPPLSLFGFVYTPGGAGGEGALVNEDREQLLGQAVGLNSGTISITSNAFLYYRYQEYGSYIDPEAINSIGNLTAF